MPTADVSVRIAWADDAGAMASVQVGAWRAEYADRMPAAFLDALDPDEIAAAWHQSLNHPAEARNRALVGLEHNTVVGFAVTVPATDPDCDPGADGELAELVVDPDHRRQGHGSRLVQAAVDTLVADGFTRAVTWVAGADDVRRGFLAEAGWEPDGAHRELDLDGSGDTRVKQVRLHVGLTDLPENH